MIYGQGKIIVWLCTASTFLKVYGCLNWVIKNREQLDDKVWFRLSCNKLFYKLIYEFKYRINMVTERTYFKRLINIYGTKEEKFVT